MLRFVLVAGFVSAGIALMAQAGERETETKRSGPGPQDLVCVEQQDLVLGSRPVTIYEVPRDRWFVLRELRGDELDVASLMELRGRQQRLVLNRLWHRAADVWRSDPGIAFPPGSRVALRARDGAEVRDAHVQVVGYLADP